MAPREYRIAVPDAVLDDLRGRLAATRWPDPLEGVGWDYGGDIAYIRELCQYWRTHYDWRAHEAALNGYDQFVCEVDGVDLHFWHVRGRAARPFPLMLLHGWPGSIYEFFELIHPLTDPRRRGRRRSRRVRRDRAGAARLRVRGPAAYAGMEPRAHRRRARHAHGGRARLPPVRSAGRRLGLRARRAARVCPRRARRGNPCQLRRGVAAGRPDRRRRGSARALPRLATEGDRIQPAAGHEADSLTLAQSDSPAGLAAWIVEKFRTWSDCGGELESVFSKDSLLTNVMFYWAPNSAASAARIYAEARRAPAVQARIDVPTAVAAFPREPWSTPRTWVERLYNVTRWTDMPRGGHFAALEQPQLLVDDVRAFFRTLR
jgi:pimeloyl-ACP methyl ester carboxylesterase